MKHYQIKLIVVSSIYLVLFGGLIFLAILPTLNQFNQNKLALRDTTSNLEKAQSDFANLVKLKKNDAELQEIKKNVISYLPDEKSTNDFVVKIESLSGELGIQVPALNTVEPKTAAKPTQDDTATSGSAKTAATTTAKATSGNPVEFSLNFTSDYSKIQEFISRMNSLLRLNSLEKVTITNYNPDSGEVDFSTDGKIYYGK